MKRFYLLSLIWLIYIPGNSQSYAYTTKNNSDIARVLNTDGTINTKNFSSGTFNAEGYKISYKENGEPVFFKQTGTTVAGDENWDSNFAFPGVSPATGIYGTVDAIFIEGSDVYVGGNFAKAGGLSTFNIAKWNGGVWTNLANGIGGSPDRVSSITKYGNNIYAAANAGIFKWDGNTWTIIGTISDPISTTLFANCVAVDATGNLYAVGSFKKINGLTVNGISKWNGTVWSSLGSGVDIGASTSVGTVITQGSNVYVGGVFNSVSGVPASGIAKWNGSIWTSIGTGINDGNVTSLAIVGTDLFAGGSFNNAGGLPAQKIAKWDGNNWSAVGSGFNNYVTSLAVLGTDLYAAGDFTQSGANAINKIGKWNGSVWSNAGNGLIMDFVQALAISQQFFIVGGVTDPYLPLNTHNLARWNGSSWGVVGNGLNDYANCIAIDGNNIYIGGKFTEAGGLKVNRIAKWNGVKWDSLGSGFSQGEVLDIAIVGNKLYAGGTFSNSPFSNINYLAVWNGSNWAAVGTGVSYQVFALAANGTDLYVGGNFAQAGGITCNNIAKWDGTNWSTLGSGTNDIVKDIKIASDGTLYAGGNFTIAGAALVNRIAKWNGTSWSAMASGVNGFVNIIALNTANEIYIGGQFDVGINGSILNHIAKFNGTAWVSLGGGVTVTGNVFSILTRGNDVFVGGDFSVAGTVSANNIAKWDGSSWSPLGAGFGKDPTSYAIPMGLAINCNSLYAVGYFATAGDKRSDKFARYWMDGLPAVSISTATTTVCTGTNVTFNATPVNGGTTPGYQWQVNGINAGTNSNSFTTSTLVNNAQVKVVLSGNAGCISPITATSNTITMTVNSPVAPSLTISGVTTVNQGVSTLLTALPVNGGNNPSYNWADSTSTHSWQIIAGANSVTLNYVPTLTGDKIRGLLTSNANCASPSTAVSNVLAFTVNTITAISPVAAYNYGIRIYPNPVHEILFIDSLKLADRWQTADITSMDGRKLIASQMINNRTQVNINIAVLPAGEYIAILRRTKGAPAYLKFIKK